MPGWAPLVPLLSGVAVAAVLGAAGAAMAADDDVRRQLEVLSRRRVYFGHQSVGRNVLDGLGRLAASEGVRLRVVEVAPGAPVPAGTLAHALVGQNGRPEGKLEAFARAIDALPEPGVDVALVKLCYVDFSADTDAAALAARYQETLAALKRRHPRTTFVHVTAPLTTVQGGPKALLKRLLGRAPGGLAENARREQYNAILRRAYLDREPIFDLALLEATAPDGRVAAGAWRGLDAPSLQPAFASDEGHLNAAGQDRAARALLSALASAPAGGAAADPP